MRDKDYFWDMFRTLISYSHGMLKVLSVSKLLLMHGLMKV